MNIGITWGQFILAIILLLVIYYGALFLRFFNAKFKRHEAPEGKPGVRKRIWVPEEIEESTGEDLADPIPGPDLDNPNEEWQMTAEDLEEEKIFESLETLAAEIEEAFSSGELLADKTKLISRLEDCIRAHPLLQGAAFKNAIVNLIARKAMENNISIVRAEALALWPE